MPFALTDVFADLPDPRMDRNKRHHLTDSVLAKRSGRAKPWPNGRPENVGVKPRHKLAVGG